MGAAVDLHCKACGYVADHMVLGLDCGEVSVVHSVACLDCLALRIVVLPEWPPLLRDTWGDRRERRVDFSKLPPLRCPVSDTHRVEPWYHPGPCPRCGAPNLRMGKHFIIWD